MRKQPPELQFLDILSQRTKLTAEEQRKLTVLRRGYQGEVELDQLVELFYPHPEMIMDDLTLSYSGQIVQIDKLLAVEQTLFVIDCKNYHGNYDFKNGSWFRNNKVLPHNILDQLDRACDTVLRIFQDNGVLLNVQGVIFFSDPNANISFQQPSKHLVKFCGEMVPWLKQIEHNATQGPQSLGWKRVLQNYRIPALFPEYDCDEQRFVQKGLCCPRCFHFKWQEQRFSFICSTCGFVEIKEIGYVRTICDYGVLHFTKDIQRQHVYMFLGPDYKETYLKLMLRQHFIPGKRGHYLNQKEKFDYWFADQTDYFARVQQRIDWHK
ncbi:hypothetical protein LFYK43_01720 [Ligilactobacillus salitolerans]|uniref:NERD domain-containing protein n=1 Tax=Ligilactobacillus salitolerans TaxID=1808352 RepID=A0A401IQC0_9LACO|nr:nuclease-related domain-containing protein [Ligilactobacillus salitolerans]GBG93713.1 hypothetical protein LFYK43_01720 [Ligilactobacillus salitolerans]